MRICPECGHVDPEWWRPAAFHQHIDYVQMDVIEEFEPEIIEALKDKPAGTVVFIEPFAYWKSPKSETIRRSSIEDYKIKGKSVPQERVSHNPQHTLDMNQLEDDSINLRYVNHPKLAEYMTNTDKEPSTC